MMLVAEGLTKQYGAYHALKDVTLRVDRGDILGLLGRNGAGKSTLMNLLTGYLGPTEGTVTLDGISLADEPARVKARIGYLPEIPPLYADLTVDESLRFAAEIKRIPKRNRAAQIDDVLAKAGVADHRARLVRHLSKGYRQRVGLAQAMLGSPDVLILDEPSAGLDPTQIAQMLNVIRRYAEEHAVIVSSHILGEVSDVCNRVLVLDRGRVAAYDTMANLLADHSRALLLRFPACDAFMLERLVSVAEVLRLPDAESGCIDAMVTPKGDDDLRATVFGLFRDEGATLLTLRPKESVLDDVFRGLTAHDESEADV